MEPMNNFTPRAQQVLALARKEADRFHHNYVGTEHLLLGLIKLGQGVAVSVLQKMGLDREAVRGEVEKQVGIGQESKTPVGSIPYTPRVKKVLALAGKEAKALNHSYVGTEHILLGLLREGEGVAARVLKTLEVDIERTRNEILRELDPQFSSGQGDNPAASSVAGGGEEVAPRGSNPEDKKEVKTPALKAFGRDLTELARKGEMDPVIGRKNEISRVIQILCRRTKNNPVLVGEAGVGKTAIVEGLAQEIAKGNVPEILADKKVITLDLALMVAGTKYRGQFEERIKAVMDEIKRSKNVIIFIDELHTIVGAGAAEGAMDASNIFKPALSRGELQCIGATTLNEYRKYIEKDSALDRRFQSVKVEAPSVEDTILILQGIRGSDEEQMTSVVAEWTGIPLSRMEKKESERLLNLEAELQTAIVGQNPATIAIARALRRSRADLKDPRRPIGSFMFMGPTGVGKTELAKQLAAQMFGSQDAIIQIDMSEYMEKIAVSRLDGSPPGYVGDQSAGPLTQP